MVKQEPVDLKQQTIFGFIPYLNLYAIHRIQKLKKYILIGVLLFVCLTIVESIVLIVLSLSIENSEPGWLGEVYRSTPVILAHVIGGMLFSGFLVRRWSKQWNEQFSKDNDHIELK